MWKQYTPVIEIMLYLVILQTYFVSKDIIAHVSGLKFSARKSHIVKKVLQMLWTLYVKSCLGKSFDY